MSSNPEKTEVYGQIQQQHKQVIYNTWIIDNFCDIRKRYSTGEAIYSPVFYTDVKSQWQIELFPQGDIDGAKEYISLYAFYRSGANITAQVTYSIMDGTQELYIMKTRYIEHEYDTACGFCKYLKFSDISAILLANNNKLIIKCTIKLDNKSCTESQKKETQIHFRTQKYDNFEKLLNNNKFSDVILTAGGETIHAHKNILAINCDVFAAMFEHDMAEKEQNVVEIKDISANVLKEMLRYIYVGKVNDITVIASDLLVAADKYLLKNLKDMCEETLCKDLSPSNVIEYIAIAKTHNASKLKAEAIQYIVSNAEKCVNDPTFQSYGDVDSGLMCEIFQKLIIERVDKKPK